MAFCISKDQPQPPSEADFPFYKDLVNSIGAWKASLDRKPDYQNDEAVWMSLHWFNGDETNTLDSGDSWTESLQVSGRKMSLEELSDADVAKLQKPAKDAADEVREHAKAWAEAETGRAEAETARATAETGRVKAEEERVSAEGTRSSNETSRQEAEQARATAENGRQEAETGRAEAETARATAETGRVKAEEERVSAEGKRSEAESARETAESGRVSAEQQRVTEFAKLKRQSQAATDAAIRAAEAATEAISSLENAVYYESLGEVSDIDLQTSKNE